MSYEAKLMCGIILLTIPSIQFGGHFLLQVLSGKQKKLELTSFQKSMFRAGHAHAGVLVLLALICELLLDSVDIQATYSWLMRVSFPLAAILVSGGFFAAAIGKNITSPTKGIRLLYVGVFILAAGLIGTGTALIFH